MEESVLAAGGATRRWWDLTPKERNIVAFTLLFLITLPMLTKIFTSDFGTHIALGRHIVRQLDIPTREHWNYPSLGMENGSGGEWGFEAVLYLVYAATGEYGVSFFVWAVVFGIFLFLYRAMVLRGAHPILAVLAIFAFSGFLRIRIQPRPEIFTYLFTAMTIYLLSEHYFGSRKKLIYLFPPMILVWANSHPTYLMAFGLCGAFFADALLRAAWKKEFRWARLRTWVIPPLVTGVAGLVLCGLNPHGYGWLLAPLHMISRAGGGSTTNNILMSISELTPVKGTGFYLYYKAAVVFAAVSLCLGLAGRRVYLLDLFLFAIAFKGAWDSARAVSMMGLFLSPGVSLHLTGFVSAAARWFSAKVTRKAEAPREKGRQKGKKGPRPGNPARALPSATQPSSVWWSSPLSLSEERRCRSPFPSWSTGWESRSTSSLSRRRSSFERIPSRERCSTSSTSGGSSTGSSTPALSPSSTAGRTTSRCSWSTSRSPGGCPGGSGSSTSTGSRTSC